jgi:hypothetical protein
VTGSSGDDIARREAVKTRFLYLTFERQIFVKFFYFTHIKDFLKDYTT